MILVLLGTQNNSFHRLLEEIDKKAEEGLIADEIIVQEGFTKYNSVNLKIFKALPKEKYEDLITKANFIITHGGLGSIEDSLKRGKRVIAVARHKKYGEHVNDHQTEIVKKFNEKGYLIGIEEVSELEDAIKKIRTFKPVKYERDSTKMIEVIKKFIENN